MKINLLPFISLMILLRCAPQNNNSTVEYIHDTTIVTDTLKIIKVDTLIIFDTLSTSPEKIVTELFPISVRCDSVIHNHSPENVIDNIPYYSRENRGTRFALPGYPHWLVFNFEEVTKIDSIEINTFGWNEDYNHTVTVFSWGDSLTQFTTKSKLYSGHRIEAVTSQLILRIDSGKNKWTDIGGVKIYSKN